MEHRSMGLRRLLGVMLILAAIVCIGIAGFLFIDNQSSYAEINKTNSELAEHVSDTSGAPDVDWASLKAINEDVAAWIQIPGTVVNYPIYHTTDNDFYLTHNAYKEYSLGGQLFIDSDNSGPNLVENQTLVYGHHLKDGSAFKTVDDMRNQDVFDSVDTIWYVTEEKSWEMEPLLVYHVEEDDQTVREFQWDDVKDFRNYLMEKLSVADAAAPDAAATIGRTSHVLSLFTCNYIDGKGRTILITVPRSNLNISTVSM